MLKNKLGAAPDRAETEADARLLWMEMAKVVAPCSLDKWPVPDCPCCTRLHLCSQRLCNITSTAVCSGRALIHHLQNMHVVAEKMDAEISYSKCLQERITKAKLSLQLNEAYPR